MITVFASFYPNEKDVENVKKILQGMVEPTRNEEGNVTYDLYSMDDVENEGTETFHLFQVYILLKFNWGNLELSNLKAKFSKCSSYFENSLKQEL